MTHVPDLIQDAQLETRFTNEYTIHTYIESGRYAHQRGMVREEHWRRMKQIGGGAYGRVWLERCVKGRPDIELRAVKEVLKVEHNFRKVNYYRELGAISKFSHRKYEHCFVKSFGWYENENSVFIAMEYFEHGDLRSYLQDSPPLPEEQAQRIAFQVLEGLNFMHHNRFAHRDLKPGNILVKFKPPDPFWVKLTDFGISKRAEDNVGATTHVGGTLGYMSPELLEKFFSPGPLKGGATSERIDRKKAQAADMWALGEITFQMLTKEPTFKSLGLLAAYTQSPASFPSPLLHQHNVSIEAINFIRDVMKPKPDDRLTAAQALARKWMDPSRLRIDDSVPIVETIEASSSASTHVVVRKPKSILRTEMPPPSLPASVATPSARWGTPTAAASPSRSPSSTDSSSVTDTDLRDTSAITTETRSTSIRIESEDALTIRPPTQARFFVLKSYNETNIETSSAHGIWCCNKNDNTRLSNAHLKTAGQVFLIFSVNESRKFCGVAQMTSTWRPDVVDVHWEDGTWEGGFTVQWLSWNPIRFDDVEHLTQKEDGGLSINRVHFTTELCTSTGLEMMCRFGLSHLFPPLTARRVADASTVGSLGVDRLRLATTTNASTSAIGNSNFTRPSVPDNNQERIVSNQLQRQSRQALLRTLRSQSDEVVKLLPSVENPRSDYAYDQVRVPWNKLTGTLVNVIKKFLPVDGERPEVSLQELDDMTTTIYKIRNWDNPAYNITKQNAYRDISRAWAACIRQTSMSELRQGGWEDKLRSHNRRSGYLLKDASTALESALRPAGTSATFRSRNLSFESSARKRPRDSMDVDEPGGSRRKWS